MGLKIFGPSGIDQISNNLLRPYNKLRDALNIKHNKSDEFVKREGTEINVSTRVQTVNNSDMIYIKSMDTYFYFDGVNYIDTKRGVVFKYGLGSDTPATDKILCSTESLGCLLFTHVDDPNSVMKYDGQFVYRAGLPAPYFNSINRYTPGVTPQSFSLLYMSYVDAKGNLTYGPANTFENFSDGFLDFENMFEINLSITPPPGEWPFSFAVSILNPTDNDIYLGPGDGTVNYPANYILDYGQISPDIEALQPGDKIPFRPFSDNGQVAPRKFFIFPNKVNYPFPTILADWDWSVDTILMATIKEIDTTAQTIEFEPESFKKYSIIGKSMSLGVGMTPRVTNIHGALFVHRWKSSSELVGYSGIRRNTNYPMLKDGSNLVDAYGDTNFNPLISTKGDYVLLSGEYDLTTSKLRPPPCKYVLMYGYQLVCGNIVGFYDFDNQFVKYTNDDLIMYSDLSLGDTPEAFSENNRQLIGETHDGSIVGLGRVNDSLIVMKDRGLHSLDGVLLPGYYAKRKIPTDSIGCETFKSILQTDKQIFFQGRDGIYATNGFKTEYVSRGVENLFDNIDPKKTRSIINPKDEEYLFYVEHTNGDNYIFAINYRTGGLFIWKGLDASCGLVIQNDWEINLFGANDITRKFIPEKNDSGTAIDAWIKTSWLDNGEPSLNKKMIGFRLFSMNNLGQLVDFQIFNDWSEANFKPLSVMEEMSSAAVKTKNQKIDIQQAMSISLYLGNNVIDEDLNISGYEIDWGPNQTKDKNVT